MADDQVGFNNHPDRLPGDGKVSDMHAGRWFHAQWSPGAGGPLTSTAPGGAARGPAGRTPYLMSRSQCVNVPKVSLCNRLKVPFSHFEKE